MPMVIILASYMRLVIRDIFNKIFVKIVLSNKPKFMKPWVETPKMTIVYFLRLICFLYKINCKGKLKENILFMHYFSSGKFEKYTVF